MALKDISSGRSDIYRIDPKLLKIKEGWNSRDKDTKENIEHINMLCASISEIGVQEPIKVSWEDNQAFITNGHCRYYAVMKAIKNGVEIKTVPVIAEQRHANEADRIFTQIASNSGKPFTQLEQAKVFKKLLDLGWQQKDIASKAGLSGGRVSQILELLTLPEGVKKLVADGSVSAGMAVKTVKEDGSKATEKLTDAVKTAKAEGKTRAMPKHTGGDTKPNLKTRLKDIITDAYTNARVDDSEKMVTLTVSEDDWAELLDRIGY